MAIAEARPPGPVQNLTKSDGSFGGSDKRLYCSCASLKYVGSESTEAEFLYGWLSRAGNVG